MSESVESNLENVTLGVNSDLIALFGGSIPAHVSGILPEHRKWIAERVLNRQESAASLARRLNIGRGRIVCMVATAKKGKSFHCKRGRPRILDSESMSKLEEVVSSCPSTSYESLKTKINTEYYYCKLRRLEAVDDAEATKKMTTSTVHRYIHLLK